MAQLFVDATLLVGVLLFLRVIAKLAMSVPQAMRPFDKPVLQEVTHSYRLMIIAAVGMTVFMTITLYLMITAGELVVLGLAAFSGLNALIVLVWFLSFTKWHGFAVATIAVAAVTAWAIWPNWLTVDILAVMLLISVLLALLSVFNSFKAAATLAGALFAYDILNVFGTGNMNKLAHVALDHGLPALVIIPAPSFFHSHAKVGLGLGDIVIPGLLVLIACVVAYRHHKKSISIWPYLGMV